MHIAFEYRGKTYKVRVPMIQGPYFVSLPDSSDLLLLRIWGFINSDPLWEWVYKDMVHPVPTEEEKRSAHKARLITAGEQS